jgi:hypothetical protein
MAGLHRVQGMTAGAPPVTVLMGLRDGRAVGVVVATGSMRLGSSRRRRGTRSRPCAALRRDDARAREQAPRLGRRGHPSGRRGSLRDALRTRPPKSSMTGTSPIPSNYRIMGDTGLEPVTSALSRRNHPGKHRQARAAKGTIWRAKPVTSLPRLPVESLPYPSRVATGLRQRPGGTVSQLGFESR